MIRALEQGRPVRLGAVLLTASLIAPPLLAGERLSQNSAPLLLDDTPGAMTSTLPMTRTQGCQGLSTRQKVILLTGAAALYYMYKRHQAKAGQRVQYYRSKNGRVYYREPNNPRQVHWVTPPAQGFLVPVNEAAAYSGIQGYNNSRSGRSIASLFPLMALAPAVTRSQVGTGMSARQKVALLTGAAALYYMYKKHQAKAGQPIQYYRSRNGRVYYREPNNPQQVHWVTPPAQGFRVPVEEAAPYRGIEGYNNSRSGRSLDDLFPLPSQ
jgi:ribosomal protein L24E